MATWRRLIKTRASDEPGRLRATAKRGRLRSAVLATWVVGCLVLGFASAPQAFAFTWLAKVCVGFDGCNARGMGNAGYQNEYLALHWNMLGGHNCTNYTAYRMGRMGVPDPRFPGNGGGNASNWGNIASQRGYAVDKTPNVGDVAWFAANPAAQLPFGHVAYVESVDLAAGKVRVSEDNYGGDFDWRDYYINDVSGFIHFVPKGPANQQPIGSLDEVRGSSGQVSVRGWAFDPDSPGAPIDIHLYIGGPAGVGEGHNLGAASLSRPDVGTTYPAAGSGHGFQVDVPTGVRGTTQIYLYAIDSAGGNNPLIASATVSISNPDPVAYLDFVGSPLGGAINVIGWAIDPDAPLAPVAIHVYVGGGLGSPKAEGHNLGFAQRTRTDVGSEFPGTGNNHGFNEIFGTNLRGQQPVYVYALNVNGTPGNYIEIGHTTLTIPPPMQVTPAPPSFQDTCGTGRDQVRIPAEAGTTYAINGTKVGSGTFPGPGKVTVTATANLGFVLTGTTTWSRVFSPAACDATLAVPQRPSGTTASVPVSWSVSGPAYGAVTFSVQRRVVNVSASGARTYSAPVTWISSTSARTATFTGSAGVIYQLRSQATDAAGAQSAWSQWQTTTMPIDDRAMAASGSWLSGTAAQYYGTTFRKATAKSASLAYTGYTDSIAVLGTKAPSTGKIQVMIDGVVRATVDTYATSVQVRQTLATVNVNYGRHTVKVANLATPGRPAAIVDAIALRR